MLRSEEVRDCANQQPVCKAKRRWSFGRVKGGDWLIFAAATVKLIGTMINSAKTDVAHGNDT